MLYKYLAESSEECEWLEKRIKKLEQNSRFELSDSSGTLIVSHQKFFLEGRYDSFSNFAFVNATAITPEHPTEINNIYPIKNMIVIGANPNWTTALIGREIYNINYKAEKKE